MPVDSLLVGRDTQLGTRGVGRNRSRPHLTIVDEPRSSFSELTRNLLAMRQTQTVDATINGVSRGLGSAHFLKHWKVSE
jgi:hypothetical protein